MPLHAMSPDFFDFHHRLIDAADDTRYAFSLIFFMMFSFFLIFARCYSSMSLLMPSSRACEQLMFVTLLSSYTPLSVFDFLMLMFRAMLAEFFAILPADLRRFFEV